MYLQPIFDSPDIMKQLPTEGKKFKSVDHLWRHWMGRVHKNPKCLEILSTEGLLDKWRVANNDLEFVQKGLDDYLQTKRDAFARFYFLSNDELLEILSQTKDPTRVQPFLCKVFENIKRVTFGEDMIITELFSSEGEKIKCLANVKTKEKNVETWMGDLEEEMTNSVRNVMQVGRSGGRDDEFRAKCYAGKNKSRLKLERMRIRLNLICTPIEPNPIPIPSIPPRSVSRSTSKQIGRCGCWSTPVRSC